MRNKLFWVLLVIVFLVLITVVFSFSKILFLTAENPAFGGDEGVKNVLAELARIPRSLLRGSSFKNKKGWIGLFTLKTQPLSKKDTGLSPELLKKRYPILLINLFVDRINSKMEIKSIKKGFGFAPDYKNPNMFDFLEATVYDKKNNKKSYLIPLSTEILYDQWDKNGNPIGPPPKKLDKFEQTIILPANEENNILLKKDFQKEGLVIKSSAISFFLPKFNQLKNNNRIPIKIDNQLKVINIEDLIQSTSNDYLIETIFDGNPAETDPAKILDIVFVSTGFSQNEFTLFRNFIKRQADSLIGFETFPGKEPFSSHKRVIKVRSVLSSKTFHEPNYPCYINESTINNLLVSLNVPYDQIAMTINQICGSGASNGFIYLSRLMDFGENDNLVLTHEIGHSFGYLLDEYYGSKSCNLDVFGRNCKEDPSEGWIANQPGGSYRGCYYCWNNYRPEYKSLMGWTGQDLEFNAPSKFLLEEAFSAITENGVAPYLIPHKVRALSAPQGKPQRTSVYVYNLGSAKASIVASLSPDVPWIVDRKFNIKTDEDIRFTLDPRNLTDEGKYETTLIIGVMTSPPITRRVPISLFIGHTNDTPTISITQPLNNQIFTPGEPIILNFSSQIQPAGWYRLEFYFAYSNNDWGQLFDSRTIFPIEPTDISWALSPFEGNYQIWIKGYPLFKPSWDYTVESAKVNLTIARPTPTPTPVPDSCLDSDNGVNQSVKGRVTVYHQGKSQSYEDFCSKDFYPGKLIEYYCEENLAQSQPIDCPAGCQDGRCL